MLHRLRKVERWVWLGAILLLGLAGALYFANLETTVGDTTYACYSAWDVARHPEVAEGSAVGAQCLAQAETFMFWAYVALAASTIAFSVALGTRLTPTTDEVSVRKNLRRAESRG